MTQPLVTDFVSIAVIGDRALECITQLCTQRLLPNEIVYGAFLNLQGRVLFDAYLDTPAVNTVRITLPACMAEEAQKHIAHYGRFYRIQTELRAHSWAADTSTQKLILEPLPQLNVASPDWVAHEIALGLPRIRRGKNGLFTPQALDLAHLGGIVFDKGCYLGQEITHRTHMRSTAKQGLYRGIYEGNAQEAVCLSECPRSPLKLFVAFHDWARNIPELTRLY